MTQGNRGLSFCIVTPTFNRTGMLSRFLRNMPKHTYRDWNLLVVHDGPNPEVEALVARHAARDARIHFASTPEWNNDFGLSPRLFGVKEAVGRLSPDYFLFWDDDNVYNYEALARIDRELRANDLPDALLVTLDHGYSAWGVKDVIPPPGVSAWDLDVSQVDMACIVVRPAPALEEYQALADLKRAGEDFKIYNQDYMFFDRVRKRDPKPRLHLAREIEIGQYDGLRRITSLRRLFRLPPLHIRSSPWFRALTLGLAGKR